MHASQFHHARCPQTAIERRKQRVEQRKSERKATDDAEKREEEQRAAKAADDNWMFKWVTDEDGNVLPTAGAKFEDGKGGEPDISRKAADGDLE